MQVTRDRSRERSPLVPSAPSVENLLRSWEAGAHRMGLCRVGSVARVAYVMHLHAIRCYHVRTLDSLRILSRLESSAL